MRSINSFLLFLLCGSFVAFSPSHSEAGPWSKNTGGYYVKANGNAFLANGFRNAQGDFVDDVSYLGVTSSAYFEVGIYGGLQIQGTLPYTIAINSFKDSARFTQGSFADAQLGLQWSPPWRMPVVMAIRGNFKIPMYDIDALVKKYPEFGTRFPVHGDGQVDFTLWYSIGGVVPKLPLYGFVEIGYRFRTEVFIGSSPDRSFLDTFVWNGQMGWTFWRRMILTLNFRGTVGLGDDTLTQSFITLGPGLYMPVWKGLAIELTYDGTLWARNASLGHSVALGISYSY